jgi:hypothetical protein
MPPNKWALGPWLCEKMVTGTVTGPGSQESVFRVLVGRVTNARLGTLKNSRSQDVLAASVDHGTMNSGKLIEGPAHGSHGRRTLTDFALFTKTGTQAV